ncbi:MAG: hypothetical protein K6A82_07435 [Prevotella sp.]|nr:hypothetical protein [Prevotella sp.]
MTLNNVNRDNLCGHRILSIMILCLFGLWAAQPLQAQGIAAKKGDKFFIDHADNLRHNQMAMPDVQIAKGNVRFRYKGMTLRCDSAYFNDKSNWFKAFGRVHMTRPGGVTFDCHRAHYDGMTQMIHARKNVVVRQPGRSLRCDSLDYNMTSNVANYFGGRGTLVYNGNTVVADQGDYNTETHDANFYGDVVMYTPKYRINTPTAHGNTETGLVHVMGKSVIRTSKGEIVHTNDGTYNSKTDHMELNGRSTITSPQRDVEGDNIIYNSTTGDAEGHGNVKIVDKQNNRTITGQDVFYNAKTGYSEGHGNVRIDDRKAQRVITGDEVIYNARTGHSEGHGNVKIVDKLKERTVTGRDLSYNSNTHEGTGEGNVYYIDHKSKHAFQGDYLHYTDSAAIAFGGKPGPVAKDFSEGDTLFVHADTISMKGFHMNTSQMYREIYGVNNVRAYRTDVQAVCGFLVANTRDSCMTMYDYPIVWSGNRQLVGDSIKAYMNDSTIRQAYIYGNAFSIEELPDRTHYNQISSKDMRADFIDGAVRRVDAWGNVEIIFYHTDKKDSTLIGHDYTETDTLRMYISPQRKLQKIWMSKTNGVISPMTQIPQDRLRLPHFEWFADVRPKDKTDIFRPAARKTSATVRNAQVPAPPRQHVE